MVEYHSHIPQVNGHPGSHPVSERRVTSILFADLVGFTPFAEALDPEDVRDFLSGYFVRCREVIDRYGGTVEKFIGDAVMAVWGVPTAHEDDAERAVRAGLDLIEMIGPYGLRIGAENLRLRVGIATGEVAVTIGAVGEGLVSGDAVNTASRVQARATPGEAWVDEQTAEITSNAITYEDMGEFVLKGKSAPLRLHAARGLESARRGLPDQHLAIPLTGYRRELTMVKELFHASLDEQRGRLLVIAGEPGVGKSRLAAELEDYLDGVSQTVLWHWGQCLPYGEGVAYSALVHAVRTRLDLAEHDDAAMIQHRLTGLLDSHGVGQEGQSLLLPRLAVLLGTSSGTFGREDLFAAWLQWFEILGTEGHPIVWVVEDAHHADDALLDFIEHVVRGISKPLFVLVLTRPELVDRRPRFGSGRRSSFINLEGLSPSLMGEMFDRLVADLTDGQREALVRQADGIPLYAIETVRSMMDRGEVVRSPAGARVMVDASGESPAEGASPPVSLQVLVASRLDLLPETDRAVLQDAAVLGPSFNLSELRVISPLDDAELSESLNRLRQRDLINTITDSFSPYEGNIVFVQSIFRQVAYERLSRKDRIDRHLRVANHYMAQDATPEQAGMVAQHLVAAMGMMSPTDPAHDSLATLRMEWLERAGDRRRKVGAFAEALKLYDLALEGVTNQDDANRLHLVAANCAIDAGLPDEALVHAARVVSEDREVQAKSVLAAHAAHVLAEDFASTAKVIGQFPTPESLAGLTPATACAIARIWAVAGALYLDDVSFEDWGPLSLDLAEESRQPELIIESLLAHHIWHSMNSRHRLATMFAEEAVRLARRHQLLSLLGRALSGLSSILIPVNLPLATEAGAEALDLQLRSGGLDWSYILDLNQGCALFFAGGWDECLDVANSRVLPESDVVRQLYDQSGIFAVLIEYLRGGQPVPPESWTRPEASDSDVSYAAIWPRMAFAASLYVRAEVSPAATEAERALQDAWDYGGLTDDYSILWTLTTDWLVEAGRFDAARNQIANVGSQPARKVMPLLAAEVKRLRATVDALDPRADRSLSAIEAELREAIAALDAVGATPDRARAQAVLAEVLGRQGKLDEAAVPRDEAIASLGRIGAKRWLEAIPAEGSSRSRELASLRGNP